MQLPLCVLTVLLIGESSAKERPTPALPILPGKWNAALWRSAGPDGKMGRDPLTEAVIRQTFADSIGPELSANRTLFGGSVALDPLWLWPISQKVKRKGFKADFNACDVHVHNLRSLALFDAQVWRTAGLETAAVRLAFNIPILWLTGYYTLRNSYVLDLIPVKNRQGDFNIDIKDISAYVILVLKKNDTGSSSSISPGMSLSDFSLDVNWADIEVRFDNIAGRFSTIADWTLNQV